MTLFQKQLSRPLTPADIFGLYRAVQSKCLACSGVRNGDAKDCSASDCPLHPYRLGLMGTQQYTRKKSSKPSTAEEIMLSQEVITQILQADIGDTVDLDGGKGKVVGLEHMRDSQGNPAVVLLVQPVGAKQANKEPEEFILQSGAVSSSLCVVAEHLYASGDHGRLMRWRAEYLLPDLEDKRVEGDLFFLHGTALEEDSAALLRWIGNGGAVLPEKMSAAMKERIRDYIVKSAPALKSISFDDLRNRAARNGWAVE